MVVFNTKENFKNTEMQIENEAKILTSMSGSRLHWLDIWLLSGEKKEKCSTWKGKSKMDFLLLAGVEVFLLLILREVEESVSKHCVPEMIER